ncbi:thiamine biosynthesis regulatory [Fusarium tjaetaba]|uniref:Thiamine biosynthesis regulatory n=1 Tax=Fusarium tjaetaba TaxID=1567544 RepID=A0A8H5RZ58_9HYPO|nr:thiamine biosynthesis regulatory [Fusarium tjaetaba]KAF5641715.1 thiamine biosynthesis regulatory [Fusarium tjaetaba]
MNNDQRLVFVNHIRDAAKTVRPQGLKPQSPNALTQREDVKHIPASIDLQGFKNEVVISFFVKNLFVWIKSSLEDESPILNIFSGKADSTAGMSGLCVAEAFFSTTHSIPEMKFHASELYGRAVQKLKTDLGTKTETSRSLPHATIWSALFLGVYEMISSDSMSNWLQHCHGVAALTEMTGPYGFQMDAAKAILQINRSFISIGAMANRKRTFLEQDEWKHIPWALQPMSKTIGDYLQDILCDIPGMMEDVDHLFNTNDCQVSANFISQKLQGSFEQLNSLRISWNFMHPHSCWRQKTVREFSEIYHGTVEQVLWFSDLETAIEFVYFNTTHLILHSILGQLMSLPDTCCVFDAGMSPDDNQFLEASELVFWNHEDRYRNAQAICQCVDYMLQNEGGASGAFNLLFPLKVAYNHLSGFPIMQKWVAGVMEKISTTKGLFIAAQILEKY